MRRKLVGVQMGTRINHLMGRRRFLMIAGLGAVPLPLLAAQETAPAETKTGPEAQEHVLPQEKTDPTQERTPARGPATPLIVINPGHYKYSGENLGVYVPGIGQEYIINTQISRALHRELQALGLRAIVTRDEQNYLPEIFEFMADHKARLENEYDAYIKATHSRKRRELGRREAILQLGIMRYAEAREAAAMINIHVDDQLRKRRRRRRAEAKGFSVILNKTASAQSDRLQEELCSALGKAVVRNRCYHINNARRGIFILGNNELRFSAPSCLVECGFMRQEYAIEGNSKHICDPEVQQIYASALARGLANYFRLSGA
jgi:N-acetylmuramoyl-L-alanine amidase